MVWLDRWGATDAEVDSAMPGDQLITEPGSVATRSITLASSPGVVFQWLAQMGTGRAGWYSYDLIDNLGRPSARRLEPAWQVQRAGELIPAGPMSFETPVVEPRRALVLAVLDRPVAGHRIDFVLAYRLDSDDRDQRETTRLVTRATIAISGPLGPIGVRGLTVGDGVMVRRQLLGLRQRCG